MPKMKKFLFLYFVLFMLTGCHALPERNYVGMTRDQVIDAVAETPKFLWGKRSMFHVSVSIAPVERSADSNLYFETLDELRNDQRIRDAKLLGVYYRSHWSGFTFYYELTFRNDVVVHQRIYAYSDGITLLPIWMFFDYPGEKAIGK